MSRGTGAGGGLVKARRPTMSLVFGGALDRESGLMGGDGMAQADLRNVHRRRGRMQMRLGLFETADFGGAEPIAGLALQSTGGGIVATYTTGTREVHVWRVDGDGESPELVGLWFKANVTTGRPVVHMAENGGRMFLAHDDPFITRRAPTVFYNMETDALHPLTAEWGNELLAADVVDLGSWAAEGQFVLKFRGVIDYLEAYIIGWGYGTRQEDGPEIVRASVPGLVNDEGEVYFDVEHYWVVGARRVPVLSCVPAGDSLLAMKAAETGRIIGDSWLNFGILKADLRFGIAGSRLAINLTGSCYAWSLEGPQVSQGGPFEDLSLPLDLGGPSPDDLVEEGALEGAFVVYLPVHRELWWVFGSRAYALSLRDPQNAGWSYHEFKVPLTGGFQLYGSGALSTAPPTGYPEYESAVVTVESVRVQWLNHGHIGDETVDVFVRPDSGAWVRVRSVLVKSGPGTQEVALEGLAYGTLYDAALRHRRGSVAAPGYEGDDPGLWTATTAPLSKGQFTTTIPAPLSLTATWSRTSATDEKIDLAWEDPADTELLARRVLRDDVEIANLAAGVKVLANTNTDTTNPIAGEVEYEYKVRYYTAAAEGINAIVDAWSGPVEPQGVVHTVLNFVLNPNADYYRYYLQWTLGVAGALTVIQDDYACSATYALRETTAAGAVNSDPTMNVQKNSAQSEVGNEPEWPVSVRLRHELTQFTVLDHSRWASIVAPVRIHDDETANNACV